jgi:ppGpp synthetase/RelA/SpoT-type nucleotidyltranferase
VPSVGYGEAYDERERLFHELKNTLEAKASSALDGVKHIDRLAFRVKGRDSFLNKASAMEDGQPKYTNPLVELEDQVAGRVITFFRDDIAIVRARLEEWFGAVEHEVKEPSGPTEFDYESDHYVFVINEHDKPDGWSSIEDMPTTFEFQVRTVFMHAWAEPQHDLGYKAPGGIELNRETKRELAWVAASAWGADRTLNQVAARLGAFNDTADRG